MLDELNELELIDELDELELELDSDELELELEELELVDELEELVGTYAIQPVPIGSEGIRGDIVGGGVCDHPDSGLVLQFVEGVAHDPSGFEADQVLGTGTIPVPEEFVPGSLQLGTDVGVHENGMRSGRRGIAIHPVARGRCTTDRVVVLCP